MAEDAPEKPAPPDTVREYNDKGVLVEELIFPKSLRRFYDDGALMEECTGELYRDSTGPAVANGTCRAYFPGGRFKAESKFAGRKGAFLAKWHENGNPSDSIRFDDSENVVYRKQWNENGVLTLELRFPALMRKCYADGSPSVEIGGELYVNSSKTIAVANGYEKTWHWNGQLSAFATIKNRETVAREEWFENGAVKAKIDLDSNRCVFFYPDGSIQLELAGSVTIEKGDQTQSCDLKDGVSRSWHENGKPQTWIVWEGGSRKTLERWNEYGKKTAEMHVDGSGRTMAKQWTDDGILMLELNAPDSMKVFSPKSGNPFFEIHGTLYRDENEEWHPQDATMRLFDEEGKPVGLVTYKGRLIRSVDLPGLALAMEIRRDSLGNLRNVRRTTNGRMDYEANGFLREIQFDPYTRTFSFGSGFAAENGEQREFHPDGKKKRHISLRKNRPVSLHEWHENGNLAKAADLPNYYKEYREDGTLRLEAVGEVVWENGEFQLKDGKLRLFDSDGKTVEQSVEYRNFEPVAK